MAFLVPEHQGFVMIILEELFVTTVSF